MNIQLRPVTQELISKIPEWYQREDLDEYFRSWPPLADINRPDLLASALGWAFGVYEGETLVGLVQFYNANQTAQVIEYGILVDSNLVTERKGINLKVYQEIENYVFKGLKYRKIYVRVLQHRTELIQKMLSIGASQEGLLSRSCRYRGKICNEVLFANFNKEN